MATKNKKNSSNVGKNIIVSILALVIGVLIGYVFSMYYFSYRLEFKLLGRTEQNIGLNTEYTDKGFVCSFDDVDYSGDVVVTYYDLNGNEIDKIDTTTETSYVVKYSLEVDGIKASITRILNVVKMEDLEFHFMMLGNESAGDSIYIKAGETDILIDAGSINESATTINSYLKGTDGTTHSYVTDGKLEYVIATHADQDHIAAFPGVLSEFDVDTIIDFPLTNKTTKTYQRYRDIVNTKVQEGSSHYTALECYNNENGASRVYEIAVGIEMEILYNYYYENKSDDENNYSVCLLFRRGDDKFFFSGDLEKEGEEKLVEKYKDTDTLDNVYLYKAGHHGSKTSSTLPLLQILKPEVVVVPCVAFTTEYTKDTDNIFPTKIAINNFVSVGVKHLYVPAMTDGKGGYVPANGNIIVYSNKNGNYVECSETNEDFYNFDIFKQYRDWK